MRPTEVYACSSDKIYILKIAEQYMEQLGLYEQERIMILKYIHIFLRNKVDFFTFS